MSAADADSMTAESDAPEQATARAEMGAAEALAILLAGKELAGVRVRRLVFKGEFALPVRVTNCTLVAPQFHGATFREGVSFAGSTVEKPAWRGAVLFEKDFDVSHAVFLKAPVYGVTVGGKFSAAYAEFRGKGAFAACVFQGVASFWEAKFAGWADFKECQFHSEADFRSVSGTQGVNFAGCHFRAAALFRGIHVAKKFDAGESRFDGLLDFSKAKLPDFVYLEAIKQGPAQRFAFLNAVAERIRVSPGQLQGRVASEVERRYDDAMQEYGLLKRCYSALHRYDHEDWAFYRFKVAQRKSQPVSWKRPWTIWRHAADWLFLDLGCGYGTNPLRAVRMAAVIVLSFAAVYAANVEDFYIEKLPFEGAKTDPANRLMVGFTTSVSVFTSGMGGIREVAKGWMNVPVMVESVMGSLLFGLFIVAFSRKVIR